MISRKRFAGLSQGILVFAVAKKTLFLQGANAENPAVYKNPTVYQHTGQDHQARAK